MLCKDFEHGTYAALQEVLLEGSSLRRRCLPFAVIGLMLASVGLCRIRLRLTGPSSIELLHLNTPLRFRRQPSANVLPHGLARTGAKSQGSPWFLGDRHRARQSNSVLYPTRTWPRGEEYLHRKGGVRIGSDGERASGAEEVRFENSAAVKAFLLGRWTLQKSLDYRVGGGAGTLTGEATFTETALPDVLMYEEIGELMLKGASQNMTARKSFAFNTAKWPVEVYFVDDPTKTHLDTLLPELDVHTSFFHDLPFDQDRPACGFSHPCIDDMYVGEFTANGKNSFEWNWGIVGPAKDGEIRAVYHRADAPLD